MIKGPVPCAGCCTNTIRGMIYELPDGGGYLCEDCVQFLCDQDGIEVEKPSLREKDFGHPLDILRLPRD